MARMTETVCIENASRVNVEEGVIYGVKLLGEHSRNNGRRYTPEAMREAVGLYEGSKLYVDHPRRESIQEDRKFADWAGVFRNVRYKEGRGIFADEHLRRTSEHFDGIIDAAQNFPNEVGHSHVVDADFHIEGDSEIVESIAEVFSVDLVTDPATTAGMFESRRQPIMSASKPKVRMTLRKIIESTPKRTKHRQKLIEMLEGDLVQPEEGKPVNGLPVDDGLPVEDLPVADDVVAEVEPEATPEEMIRNGLMAAIAVKLENATDEQLQAVMGVFDLDTSITAISSADSGPEGLPFDEGAPAIESTLRTRVASLEAKTMLLESGRNATDVRIRALASASPRDRKPLLESWPTSGGSQGGPAYYRPTSSPPALMEGGNNNSLSLYEARVKKALESESA